MKRSKQNEDYIFQYIKERDIKILMLLIDYSTSDRSKETSIVFIDEDNSIGGYPPLNLLIIGNITNYDLFAQKMDITLHKFSERFLK